MNWFRKWFHNCMCETLIHEHAKLAADNRTLIDRNNKLHDMVRRMQNDILFLGGQIRDLNRPMLKPITRKPKNAKKA